jgi:hypothetical protein
MPPRDRVIYEYAKLAVFIAVLIAVLWFVYVLPPPFPHCSSHQCRCIASSSPRRQSTMKMSHRGIRIDRRDSRRSRNTEKLYMLNRRTVMALAVGASLLTTAGIALAKNAHHTNGHNLLGEKIHKNGKHEVGKIGANSVIAEVSNDKVVGMSAGSLPVQKVKSNKKMAASGDTINVATSGTIRLAQLDAYYGYCFDTGIDLYCYWYPATDVIVTDAWTPYP